MALRTSSHCQRPESNLFRFASRRSVIHSTKGIISCSQPLAAKCGLEILQAGGNAADAAVGVGTLHEISVCAIELRRIITASTAAGLSLTEPLSTGLGGDMFVLFWDASSQQVRSLNGSGRSGANCTLKKIREDLGIPNDTVGEIPKDSVHAVTVPGAPAGWVDTVSEFGSGKVTLEGILRPAIQLAEEGFPVSEITAEEWADTEAFVRKASPNTFTDVLKLDPSAPGGARAPLPGEIMKNPKLAQVFRSLGKDGKAGFYQGEVAEKLVEAVQVRGGHLKMDDLTHHMETGSQKDQVISLAFTGQGLCEKNKNGGIKLWEHAPNGQGIIALMAMGILQELEKDGKIPVFGPQDFNSPSYLHAIIEALRLAFADASWFVTDPSLVRVPTKGLLSTEYLSARAKLFDASKSLQFVKHGHPPVTSPALQSSDTVYFAVSDSMGNAVSFIGSNYERFGSGIVPKDCGFALQNRGANFSLDCKHPNKLEPRKRPYHTIIPGMVSNLCDGSLHSVFGVMGGFMQPQGHVQVLLGQIVGQLGLQQALDAPRFCIGSGYIDGGKEVEWTVNIEEGMPIETIEGLKRLGHKVTVLKNEERQMFGRGQIIRLTTDPITQTPKWSAGSDMRADGAAYPM